MQKSVTTRKRALWTALRIRITISAATIATIAITVKKAMLTIARSPHPLPRSSGGHHLALGGARVGDQQHLLRVDERGAVVVGQLVVVPEHDRLGRADLLTVAAEDTADHVDLVALGVALARRDAVFLGV